MSDDTTALVDALRRGEERAWRELIDAYGRLIYSVAARSGLDETDREEVFQTTCVVAVRTIGALRDPSRLSSWLYGIAHRLSADVHRKRKRRGTEIDVTDDPAAAGVGESGDAVDEVERLEATSHLYDALGAIDDRCASLVRALYLEDPRPSYEAIGERFDMPVGSIGPTRARCLKKLERLLAEWNK